MVTRAMVPPRFDSAGPTKEQIMNGDDSQPTRLSNAKLAEYIIEFLMRRNAGELSEAFENQRVKDRSLMLGELEMIIAARGKPSNWV